MELKGENIAYSLSWEILKHSNTCTVKRNSGQGNLCIEEKYQNLLSRKSDAYILINRRNELVSKCCMSTSNLLPV